MFAKHASDEIRDTSVANTPKIVVRLKKKKQQETHYHTRKTQHQQNADARSYLE